ncbi:hypothetical protein F5Y04DRAFT_292470 [Hypomontagnella monticulosa]|nr:hypothetical protein F5Y04DRAFT_292470 [Hypomontagnella monticulosa]
MNRLLSFLNFFRHDPKRPKSPGGRRDSRRCSPGKQQDYSKPRRSGSKLAGTPMTPPASPTPVNTPIKDVPEPKVDEGSEPDQESKLDQEPNPEEGLKLEEESTLDQGSEPEEEPEPEEPNLEEDPKLEEGSDLEEEEPEPTQLELLRRDEEELRNA